MASIPVIDIFAGPGGLGEGFSSLARVSGRPEFKIALSIEKERWAHSTLRLRAFQRLLGSELPEGYWPILERGASWAELRDLDPRAAAAADREALRLELSPESARGVGELVDAALRKSDRWVLVGGPPCQAYSLVGRSRNRGNPAYVPETDKRQTLYLEYLQILGDHAPPVFIMENVKGLLSATFQNQRLFERIVEDLHNPAKALGASGRPSRRQPRYEVLPLTYQSDSLFPDEAGDRAAYVIRAELFGVPQARHRVILLGIRSDLGSAVGSLTPAGRRVTVRDAIRHLPRLRSGVSRAADSTSAWISTLKSAKHSPWISTIDPRVRAAIRSVLSSLVLPRKGRGGEVLNVAGRLVLNHSSRSHMGQDLHRYLFASCYAATYGVSPPLSEFPVELRPDHKSVARAMEGGHFADRFRVQVAARPATTITSHISKDGHYYIHYDPTQCRSLTVREAAELQTFPPLYFFAGPRTAQYQQVGNAVPPTLASQIAALVADLIA